MTFLNYTKNFTLNIVDKSIHNLLSDRSIEKKIKLQLKILAWSL